MSTGGGPGRGGTAVFASPGRPQRRVAFAPAVRGYPGGITDMASDPDELGTDESLGGSELWAGPADAGPGDAPDQVQAGGLTPSRQAQPEAISVWQQSAGAWQEAGIDWLRPATGVASTQARPASIIPADDDPHTEPIPVVTGNAAPAPAAEDAEDGPAARVTQEGPAAQDAQEGPAARVTQEGSAAQRAQDAPAEQESPAAQDGPAAQDVQGSPAAQDGPAEQESPSAQNGPAAQDAQEDPAARDGQETPGTAALAGRKPARAPRARARANGVAASAKRAPGTTGAAGAAPDAVPDDAAPEGAAGNGRSAGHAVAGEASPAEATAGAGDAAAGEKAVGGTGSGPAGTAAPPSTVAASGTAASPGTAAGEGTAAAPGTAAATSPPGAPDTTRRGRRLAVVTTAVVVLVAGTIAAVGIARSGSTGSAEPTGPSRPEFTLVTPYPPAAPADAEFPRQAAGAAPLLPSLTGIAAAGRTVVAIGAQPSQPASVPLMLLSTDGGRTWARATVAAPAAAAPGAPPPGAAPGTGLPTGLGPVAGPGAATAPEAAGLAAVPAMVARGGSTWLALVQHATWTSPDGRVWQPGPGVPQAAGDQVLGLTGTASGFVAVGAHTGSRAGPVVWTSTDGRAWRRESGPALGVTAKGRQVSALRRVAARGGVILAGGQLTAAPGHRPAPGVWRSTDGGRTWDRVALPASHGATGGLIGLAANGSMFLAVRPGRTGGHLDAVSYVSSLGLRWRYAGQLAPRRRTPMRVTAVGGAGRGFAVTATTRAGQISFIRTRGHGWHQAADPGSGVAAVTASARGIVVAGNGRQSPGAAGIRPHLLLAGPKGRQQVGQSVLTAAATPDTTVNALAGAGRVQVAAGAASGAPALWLGSPGGQWVPADLLLPSSWRSGALLGVAHGGAGWLTVGQAGTRAAYQPVILTSASGTSWTRATGAGALTAPGTSLAAAAAGPAGYAIVGSALAGGGPAPAAWFSADLNTWARVPLAGAGSGQVLAVTADRSGFVAVGAQGSSPAVWASSGGSAAWQVHPLPRPAGAASAALTRVTVLGDRVVAVGYAYRGAPAGAGVPFAAVSADGGRTWRESVLPGPASPAVVTALTAAGHGFVAVGHPGLPGQPGLLTWWSVDGLTWHYAGPAGGGLPGPFVTQLNAVTAENGTLTGAGFAAGGSAEHPVLWHARYR